VIPNRIRLGDYVFDACGFRIFPKLVADVHGEHDHLHVGSDAANLARRLKSIHYRHGKVENHRVGFQFCNFLHGNLAVLGLAAYLPLGGVR